MPFGTPLQAAADSVRVLCCLMGVAVIALSAWTAVRQSAVPQRSKLLVALCLLAVSAIGTEIEHLGDVVTYRLATNTIGTGTVLVALILLQRATTGRHGTGRRHG